MLFIGESINATRKSVAAAISGRDEEAIRRLARAQVDAGAHVLDVNAGRGGGSEAEDLEWLVRVVQDEVDAPLCLDSSSPEAIMAAGRAHQGVPMINSISGEDEKMEALLEVVGSIPCKVVALCVGSSGIPATAEERVDVAEQLVERLERAGIAREETYVDPVMLSVATDARAGTVAIETIGAIRRRLPGAQVLVAVSNVGFGLPQRSVLNRALAALVVAEGADALLTDVRDRGVIANAIAARTLSGRDSYCSGYLKAYRAGVLS